MIVMGVLQGVRYPYVDSMDAHACMNLGNVDRIQLLPDQTEAFLRGHG